MRVTVHGPNSARSNIFPKNVHDSGFVQMATNKQNKVFMGQNLFNNLEIPYLQYNAFLSY